MATTSNEVYYDPYDLGIYADPYPVFRRLRDEAPLYWNAEHGFYAVSRFDDIERGLVDHGTFSSSHGAILEMIKADLSFPAGLFIHEDPPLHSAHRGVLARVFTPKKMNSLEPKIREFCADALDPLAGASTFDFVADLGALMPIQVIGMLLGIPERDQQAVRESGDRRIRRPPGAPKDYSDNDNIADETFFGDYIDWRSTHPSDDLMTELLQAEFEDETGTVRRLTREEVLTFVNVLAAAGNETTNRLIGWTGKVLSDHPDQRRELVEDRSLIPNAIEEVLRYEPPALQICRYVTRDVSYYDQTVPAGSAMMFLAASANRDDRVFPDGDAFDIHRKIGRHLTFGYGIHFCLGAALARLEGRIALDEILDRFPHWQVDRDQARLDSSAVRGWETLPVVIS
jgi:cytochrome P450